ncbi:MAG: hypothetical protein F9K44_07865 [Hyphomicrobiaceae bacterium]|nr:MAG: hypothetical protein F9K44_07865 [Hyphomicrobiaceae bacterium]
MKCCHCGKDSRAPDRADGKCKSCGKAFAFDPQKGDPVTDLLFKNAIEAISGGGRIKWGVEHLYYEVARRMQRSGKLWPLLIFPIVLGGIGLYWIGKAGQKNAGAVPAIGWVLLGVAVASLVPILRKWFWRKPLITLAQARFDLLWNRWCSINGAPAGVITRQPQLLASAVTEADIGDYSFDRAVICDRARTVDLLLANNFHFENNCAVLSIDGYPQGPFQIVKKMLMRNPKLQVYAIHDATPKGCAAAHRLAFDKDWFAGKIKVVDLGLRPRHAKPFRGLLHPADTRVLSAGEGIEPGEVDWLRTYRLEIAAARPEQVLKRLFRGIQAHANDDFSSGGTTTCSAFDSTPGSSDDPADGLDGDSFG